MPSKAVVKAVAELRDAAERERTGRVLIEGPHLAFEALRRGVLLELFIADDCREGVELARAAKESGVACEPATASDLDRMAEVRTPAGVVGVARRNAPQAAAALLREHDVLVYFEAVQDPGNVGTVARTAAAFGVGALLFGPGSVDPTAPKSLRASAGALLDAPYARDVGIEVLLDAASATGHVVVVADVRQGVDYRRIAPLPRRILAIANEGAGTRIPLGSERVLRTTIPLAPGCESLNVAAAAAILLDRLRG